MKNNNYLSSICILLNLNFLLINNDDENEENNDIDDYYYYCYYCEKIWNIKKII